ncbi:MAG: hypothetical protein GWN14_05275 [candidate division Zixibacteria bacterium]|nr:hypothetical protein [candidate division Zixibacteria bacterium]
MEDATTVMILQRAAKRLIHQVPVRDMGDLGQQDLDNYIEDNERTDIYDSSRGMYTSQYTPLDYDDIYIPVPMDGELKVIPKVESLDGQQNYHRIINVLEYFEDKLFVVVGVPKSYMGIERDVNAKATLIQQELEFGRALRRIQSAWAQIYRRDIYDLQFRMLLGTSFDPKSYTIEFPNPSKVDEKLQAEIRKLDAETAKLYGDGFGLPLDQILVSFFEWNPGDAEKVTSEAGTNTQESLDLTNSKCRRMMGDLERKVVQSMRLASALETTNNIAEYLLEASEPVRA